MKQRGEQVYFGEWVLSAEPWESLPSWDWNTPVDDWEPVPIEDWETPAKW